MVYSFYSSKTITNVGWIIYMLSAAIYESNITYITINIETKVVYIKWVIKILKQSLYWKLYFVILFF